MAPAMTKENIGAESWSKYWTQASGKVGCLPGAPDALGNLLDGIWFVLAQNLDSGAKVVDLACGNGVVGGSMLSANRDLDITGVDYADVDEKNDASYPIMGSTSITQMPFDDASFDCAVSQFGLEYADPKESGAELTRILKPGSTMRFIIHNADSPIVKSNLKRQEILDHIYYAPVIRSHAMNQQLNELQSDFDGLIGKYGQEPLIIEIASAIRSTLSDPKPAREKALTDLWEGMAQEMTIINALRSAAVSQDDLEAWLSSLGKEFTFSPPETVSYENNILCWSISGTRS